MKTQEEMKALKEEVEIIDKKLAELTEEELDDVLGGSSIPGLEAIGPWLALGDGNLTPEVIQKLREIADDLKSTTQNIR